MVSFRAGIELIQSPCETRLTFGYDNIYRAVYKISPPSVPPPGKKIKAIFNINKYRIESNIVCVPGPPSTEYEKYLRQALVEFTLGEYDKLLKTAGILISENPSAAADYWYKGLALEGQGNRKEALKVYETALEKIPLPPEGEGEFHDPPMFIIQRIRYLKKLKKPE